MGKGLTAKERVFVLEYLLDVDPKRAALAAGYSLTVAESKAYQWVSNSKVKPQVYEAIQAAMSKRADKLEITAERVLAELGKMAFANVQDLYDESGLLVSISELPRDVAASVQSVKVNLTEACAVQEVKLWDKKGSLELIGKHLGMFRDGAKDDDETPPPTKVIIEVKDARKPSE